MVPSGEWGCGCVRAEHGKVAVCVCMCVCVCVCVCWKTTITVINGKKKLY